MSRYLQNKSHWLQLSIGHSKYCSFPALAFSSRKNNDSATGFVGKCETTPQSKVLIITKLQIHVCCHHLYESLIQWQGSTLFLMLTFNYNLLVKCKQMPLFAAVLSLKAPCVVSHTAYRACGAVEKKGKGVRRRKGGG